MSDVIPHLFRTEFSRIVTVLIRKFGLAQMEAAEDIVSETFVLAMETWPYKGVPSNPAAWLYTVAGNKAKNYLVRQQLFKEKVKEQVRHSESVEYEHEFDLSDHHIKDSQLQMLFVICHPSLSPESQIGLALRILCGFGIPEIANAFLTSNETINKRLYRAREELRSQKIPIEFPTDDEVNARLDSVLTTLYLLFNEGYYSESNDNILREDLCQEAMRLMELLIQNSRTNLPPVNALFALMCFHCSRFAARRRDGEVILYQDQDENLWDKQRITRGAFHLREASAGGTLSRYHLEAGIAYWHTRKEDTLEKWENILQLYNQLLQVAYSPMAALNRTYALAKARGNQLALAEAEKLNIRNNHFYFVLLGELYKETDKAKAIESWEMAVSLAKNNTDRNTIQRKIDKL